MTKPWGKRAPLARILSPCAALLLAALAISSATGAESQAQIEVSVENGLLPAIQIKGRPVPKWTLAERMKALQVRGVSIAVIHNFKIDWAKGYGILDDRGRKPVNTETLFQAGSISKPVAVTAAMALIELGKLSLDEDVNAKLKSWKVPENEFTKTQKVTLRRTMSHSAGLTVHGFPGYEAGEAIPTLPQILDGKKPANTDAVRVDTIPGTLSRYSGGGTTIMQLLMVDVTGKPFPEIMQTMVLSKAGMTHSTYQQPLPESLRVNAASGYRQDGTPVRGGYHTYPEMAAAGLWTTASDLARFAIEMGKSRQGNANHILRQSTVEQMMTVQKGDFGLGFSLQEKNGVKRFGHNGADEGFQALFTCSFDGEGVAITANSDNGISLANEVVRAVSGAYRWPDQKPIEKTITPLTSAQQLPYLGSYEIPGAKIEVKSADDHLVLRVSDGSQLQVYAEAATSLFFAVENGLTIRFALTAGKVTGIQVGGTAGKKVS
jgi:CubicO group peptidase (beta-lactamase class C family)